MVRTLLAMVLSSHICFAGETWLRLATPNLEVLTDAGAGKGREVLRRFEQIRQVMAKLMTAQPKSGAPLRIFVFRSDREFDSYKDPRRKTMAGFYHPGRDRDYIAMQNTGPDIYRIVFHEYTHVAIKHAGKPVPLWFNEGMAELFSTVETTSSQIKIGDLIPAHILTLREQKLIGLPALMAVEQDSELYNEQSKVGIFYAESWAFVHMLNLNQQYAARRQNFLELVFTGTSSEQALQQAFGKTSEQVLADLRNYVNGNRFMAGILKTEPLQPIEEIEPEPVAAAEAEIALAELLINLGKIADAEHKLGQLARENPGIPAIEAEMGDVALAQRRPKEALAHYQRAIEQGSRNARIYFEKANLVRDAEGDRDSAIQKIVPDLWKAIEIDPSYWQARHLLGYLYFRSGRYGDAVEQLTAAVRLEPRNVNVWETLALAQFYAGAKEQALSAAKQGRALATRAEEMARLDGTIQRIEAPEGPPRTNQGSEQTGPNWRNRKGDQRVEGKLVQLDCSKTGARFHVVVGPAEVVLRVDDPSKVVLTNAPGNSVQLTCGVFSARSVIVEYVAKPDAQRKTTGEITALEFK